MVILFVLIHEMQDQFLMVFFLELQDLSRTELAVGTQHIAGEVFGIKPSERKKYLSWPIKIS